MQVQSVSSAVSTHKQQEIPSIEVFGTETYFRGKIVISFLDNKILRSQKLSETQTGSPTKYFGTVKQTIL